jgi:hypothetical protein
MAEDCGLAVHLLHAIHHSLLIGCVPKKRKIRGNHEIGLAGDGQLYRFGKMEVRLPAENDKSPSIPSIKNYAF